MKHTLLAATALTILCAAPALAEDMGGAPDMHKGMHKGKGIEQLDTDKDGAISKTEFMAAHEKRFAEMDKNSDGKLDKNEIKARRDEWKSKMEERRTKMKEKKDSKAE